MIHRDGLSSEEVEVVVVVENDRLGNVCRAKRGKQRTARLGNGDCDNANIGSAMVWWYGSTILLRYGTTIVKMTVMVVVK